MPETSLPEPSLRSADIFMHRRWCLRLAIALVLIGAVANTIYLFNHCALALSEDECHYWEWARHLDFGYYSKPPGIAWVIWLAVKIGHALGVPPTGVALMPVIRMPAVLFGLCSGLLSLFLARRIFRDDRASLAVILLSAAVPMFAVGSLLITIDSPMYLGWAATVYCLWRVIESSHNHAPARRIPWLYLAGLASCLGMLFKPVLIALPLCVLVACWADPTIRRAFKTWHSLGALLLMLLSFVPMILWNSQHGWVMFRHIATQGGLSGNEIEPGSKASLAIKHLLSFLGGQAGGMGGVMFILLIVGIIVAFRRARATAPSHSSIPPTEDPSPAPREHAAWTFLLSMSVPLWAFYFVMNFWKATEPNWPAASYFAAMILLAGVLVRGWNAPARNTRRAWRTWGSIAIVLGVGMSQVAMNLQRFYPLAAKKLQPLANTPRYTKSIWFPGRWDPAAKKLRGFAERAAALEPFLQQLRSDTGKDPMVITNRYDTSSSLAFYLPGQPFVYCIMSSVGGRHSQYDVWPGPNEMQDGRLRNAGRPALIIGIGPNSKAMDGIIRPAFDHVDEPARVPVIYHGITLSEMWVTKAYGFKGLPEVAGTNY